MQVALRMRRQTFLPGRLEQSHRWKPVQKLQLRPS